ncbi:MAG: Mov34/MPN/PAD-1 family protein [Candidatus Micrarchaeota archaeon]
MKTSSEKAIGENAIGEKANGEKTSGEKIRLVITRRALESALESSRSVYPNEFIGLFRGKEKESGGRRGEGKRSESERSGKTVKLTELIIAPLSEYGEGFSSYSDIFLPMHLNALASFHSHPHPPAEPSRGDLHFFSRKGKVHFIVCPPFDVAAKESVRAFDSAGNELAFEVAER